jgi:hypothetical protein
MSTAIDTRRVRVALARLQALGVPQEAADTFAALIDRQDARRAATGRTEAPDARQLALPLVDAANDDTEGADDE